MSLSSEAPGGRKAGPLAGFPREDLQTFGGSRAGSRHGKALQASGEAAGKIRMCFGGRLCRDKGTVGSQTRPDLSCHSSTLKLWLLLSQSCPWGLFCHWSSSKPLGSVVISAAVLFDNSKKTLFLAKKAAPRAGLALVRGALSLLS